jgi:hypothetical protein
MRGIIAIGLAGLLSFTSLTGSVSAADLTMPVKAPPPAEAPPPEFCWPCLLVLVPIVVCIADDNVCPRGHEDRPVTSGHQI